MLSGGVDFGMVFAKKKRKINAKIRDQGLHGHRPYPIYIVNLGKGMLLIVVTPKEQRMHFTLCEHVINFVFVSLTFKLCNFALFCV